MHFHKLILYNLISHDFFKSKKRVYKKKVFLCRKSFSREISYSLRQRRKEIITMPNRELISLRSKR